MSNIGDKRYNFNFKIGSQDKYEIVKLIILMKLLNEKSNKSYFYIYTEHSLEDEVVSIYVEDIKNKLTKVFEIKNSASEEYIIRKEAEGEKKVRALFKKAYWRVISLDELSDNLISLSKEIEDLI